MLNVNTRFHRIRLYAILMRLSGDTLSIKWLLKQINSKAYETGVAPGLTFSLYGGNFWNDAAVALRKLDVVSVESFRDFLSGSVVVSRWFLFLSRLEGERRIVSVLQRFFLLF